MVATLLEPHCGDGMAEPITIDDCMEQVCADLTIALGIRPDTGGLLREALSHVCPGLCMPSNLVAKTLLMCSFARELYGNVLAKRLRLHVYEACFNAGGAAEDPHGMVDMLKQELVDTKLALFQYTSRERIQSQVASGLFKKRKVESLKLALDAKTNLLKIAMLCSLATDP